MKYCDLERMWSNFLKQWTKKSLEGFKFLKNTAMATLQKVRALVAMMSERKTFDQCLKKVLE